MCNYQLIVLIDNNIQTNGQRRNWVKKRKSNFVDIMPNSVMLSWKKPIWQHLTMHQQLQSNKQVFSAGLALALGKTRARTSAGLRAHPSCSPICGLRQNKAGR